MKEMTACARCGGIVCESGKMELAPAACPTAARPDVLKRGLERSLDPALKEFARQAAIQQYDSSLHLPDGRVARLNRLEETIELARKMQYRRLGLAFCSALRNESMVVDSILRGRGFEVVSVCCKVGGLSKDNIDVPDDRKLGGGASYDVMCNPVTQAGILNNEKTEFNIVIGLCVGHDSLFLKHSDAMCTVLIAKDKVLGHNPAAALRLSGPYYREFVEAGKKRNK